jgi:hypothetical protein
MDLGKSKMKYGFSVRGIKDSNKNGSVKIFNKNKGFMK